MAGIRNEGNIISNDRFGLKNIPTETIATVTIRFVVTVAII